MDSVGNLSRLLLSIHLSIYFFKIFILLFHSVFTSFPNLIMIKRPFAFNWGKMFYYANAINKYWSIHKQFDVANQLTQISKDITELKEKIQT
jgi:hypothetical protein